MVTYRTAAFVLIATGLVSAGVWEHLRLVDTLHAKIREQSATIANLKKGSSGGIGASRCVLQCNLERQGYTFVAAHLKDGRERVMGTHEDDGITVDLIGPEKELNSATMLVAINGQNLIRQMLIMRFLVERVLPEDENHSMWLIKAISEAKDGTSSSRSRGEIRLDLAPFAGRNDVVLLSVTR